MPWWRSEFEQCRLQHYLLSKEVVKAHPVPSVARSTRVSYSLNKPLGITLCNFTKVCKEAATTLPDAANCACKAIGPPMPWPIMGTSSPPIRLLSEILR